MIETINKIIIRKAVNEDKPQVVELIIQFYKESIREYGIKFDLETLEKTVQGFIDNQISIVAEEEGRIIGCIGGIVAPSIFSNQLIAQEAMWYVNSENRKGKVGLLLISAFENECVNRGANTVIMIHMNNLYPEILDRLYRMNGFSIMETHYVKNIRRGYD